MKQQKREIHKRFIITTTTTHERLDQNVQRASHKLEPKKMLVKRKEI